jgi:hypothetical protein
MDSGKHLLRPGYVPECHTDPTIVRNTLKNLAQDVAIHGSQRAPVGFLRIDDVGSAGERGSHFIRRPHTHQQLQRCSLVRC